MMKMMMKMKMTMLKMMMLMKTTMMMITIIPNYCIVT